MKKTMCMVFLKLYPSVVFICRICKQIDFQSYPFLISFLQLTRDLQANRPFSKFKADLLFHSFYLFCINTFFFHKAYGKHYLTVPLANFLKVLFVAHWFKSIYSLPTLLPHLSSPPEALLVSFHIHLWYLHHVNRIFKGEWRVFKSNCFSHGSNCTIIARAVVTVKLTRYFAVRNPTFTCSRSAGLQQFGIKSPLPGICVLTLCHSFVPSIMFSEGDMSSLRADNSYFSITGKGRSFLVLCNPLAVKLQSSNPRPTE